MDKKSFFYPLQVAKMDKMVFFCQMFTNLYRTTITFFFGMMVIFDVAVGR